jgi:hypothetical protein
MELVLRLVSPTVPLAMFPCLKLGFDDPQTTDH